MEASWWPGHCIWIDKVCQFHFRWILALFRRSAGQWQYCSPALISAKRQFPCFRNSGEAYSAGCLWLGLLCSWTLCCLGPCSVVCLRCPVPWSLTIAKDRLWSVLQIRSGLSTLFGLWSFGPAWRCWRPSHSRSTLSFSPWYLLSVPLAFSESSGY